MSDHAHGAFSGWLHLLKRGNAAAQTSADLELTAHISDAVALAQAKQSALDGHDNVVRKAGNVQSELLKTQLAHDRLIQDETKLQSEVSFLVAKCLKAQASGDSTGAATAQKQGGAAAARLKALQDEIHSNEALLAVMTTAGQTADEAAEAADQQLEDSNQEIERLNQLKVQAALARATTESVRDLTTPSTDGVTATLVDARSKVEADYADALGQQHVVENSLAAQHIGLQVEMHQAAGNDLFAAAMAAGKQDTVQPVS